MSNADRPDLVQWYEEEVRPFFEITLEADKIQAFERDLDQLRRAIDRPDTELAVCFLGNSGVGKSTLINAVLGGDQAVVPSGGVGPLTAQALVVRYSEDPGFEVDYHSAGQLLCTVFGLEQMFRAELGAAPSAQDDLENTEGIEEEDRVQAAPSPDADDQPEPSDRSRLDTKRDAWRRRAQLMVTGSQEDYRDLKYLVDSLREAAGGKRRWETAPDERDAERIRGMQRALAFAKKKIRHVIRAAAGGDFAQVLQDHATGFLAPLIKSLEVKWMAPILRQGVTLIDLPGVGVMRDVHREVTRQWIREKANALVVIVDSKGLTESVAEALRQSEFLNSLLYSADEPEDDPVVMIAVTRIDDIATERYGQQQSKVKKKFEHFRDVALEAGGKLRREMQSSLESIWLSDGEIPPSRRKVVQNLLGKLQVHPLSAPEYTKLRAQDEDNPHFLRNEDQTGIPGFRKSLIALATERRDKVEARRHQAEDLFSERVLATVRLIESQWETDSRAEEEVGKLKDELDLFLEPRRKELHMRQGGYRTFLKKTIPQKIADRVEVARLNATTQINRYLTVKLGSAHWSTLKASVKRGGRYSGASEINLPSEFALRFEEQVAEVWGKDILANIREETRDYGSDCVKLAEEVVDWALAQGARVQPKVVEAQREAIKTDARKLESVGREMVKEIRDAAKARLINHIEGPIKRRCDEFIRKNMHVGKGVKDRIVELYCAMAEDVTKAAKDPAACMLLELFRDVEKEILDALKDHDNPIEAMAGAVVSSQESYLKRNDLQKQRRIQAHLGRIFAALPEGTALTAVS